MKAAPHVGFVLERSLGHTTHADNLARLLPSEVAIDSDITAIEWATTGVSRSIPAFNNNWTVRAGLRGRRGIRRMERARRLDALFIHTQVPALLATDWVMRIPTVVSLDATPLQYDELGAHYGHQLGNAWVEKLKWHANRACLQSAAHVVTWSRWASESAVNDYGVNADKVTVIPPGVTPSLWTRRTPRNGSDGRVRILFVGGDLKRKGGDLLMKAFDRLRADLPATSRSIQVELHLVTSAKISSAPGIVVHHGLEPNSSALIDLYHLADIFCLPTRGDCLPMVLSEAGAAGLPLVSTAVAAIPEIVRDNETGLVVPLDEPSALAHALRTLVERPELRQRLGNEALRLVNQRFDAEKNTRELVELLVEVVSAARRRR
jgi:glycosyltransferase involved in cell wall biosynthesis